VIVVVDFVVFVVLKRELSEEIGIDAVVVDLVAFPLAHLRS